MPVVFSAFFEFVILAIIKSGGTDEVSNLTATVFILILSFCIIVYSKRNKRLNKYSKSLIIGLLLRLLFLYVDLLAYPRIVLPDGHSDEDMFFGNAINYALWGVSRRGTYPKIMGTLFRYIGFNRLYGQFISMLFSIVALVYLAYSLSELNVQDSSKTRVYNIACLLPYNAILSSLFMRETMIYMLLSISFYCFIRWYNTKKERYYLFSAVLSLLAAIFHSGTIAVLIGYVAIRLIYDNKTERVHVTFGNIFITLALAIVVVLILNRNGGTFLSKFNGVDSIEDIAKTSNLGASSYARYVGNSNNPINLIIFTPLRIFFFLFSPVPWMWRGISDIIAFCFSSLFYLSVVLSVIKYLHISKQKNSALVIILFIVALATVFVFAWGTSNAGTAARHRDKMMTLFAILWALSLDENTSQSRKYRRRRI